MYPAKRGMVVVQSVSKIYHSKLFTESCLVKKSGNLSRCDLKASRVGTDAVLAGRRFCFLTQSLSLKRRSLQVSGLLFAPGIAFVVLWCAHCCFGGTCLPQSLQGFQGFFVLWTTGCVFDTILTVLGFLLCSH